jgi:hypothetical protein
MQSEEWKAGTRLTGGGRMVLAPDELAAHGFPPLLVTFDLTGVGMIGMLFPERDCLLSLSGPPGGPSHFSMRVVRAEGGAPLPKLDELVRKHDLPQKNFLYLGAGDVAVDGTSYPAVAWSIKPTPWLDSRATLLIPLKDSNTALAIEFSSAYSANTGIVPGMNQDRLVKSLTLGFKQL